MLVALMAAFARWLPPRWGALPETDQVAAVLACVLLAICAVAVVLSLHKAVR